MSDEVFKRKTQKKRSNKKSMSSNRSSKLDDDNDEDYKLDDQIIKSPKDDLFYMDSQNNYNQNMGCEASYNALQNSGNLLNLYQNNPSLLPAGGFNQGCSGLSGHYTGYGVYSHKRKRRERTSFTKAQLSVLLETYALQPYPDVQQRVDIAARIGLDESRVQVWFKNRRAKERKDEMVANAVRNNVNARTVQNNYSQLIMSRRLSNMQITQNLPPNFTRGGEMIPQIQSENQFAPHHNINNRYGNLSNIPNQSSFGNLFSAQQFPDENQYEAMTQYSNLIGSNQGQPIQTSRFQNLYGGVQRYQSEGDNIENSPNSIPKLQPVNQPNSGNNFQDPSKS